MGFRSLWGAVLAALGLGASGCINAPHVERVVAQKQDGSINAASSRHGLNRVPGVLDSVQNYLTGVANKSPDSIAIEDHIEPKPMPIAAGNPPQFIEDRVGRALRRLDGRAPFRGRHPNKLPSYAAKNMYQQAHTAGTLFDGHKFELVAIGKAAQNADLSPDNEDELNVLTSLANGATERDVVNTLEIMTRSANPDFVTYDQRTTLHELPRNMRILDRARAQNVQNEELMTKAFTLSMLCAAASAVEGNYEGEFGVGNYVSFANNIEEQLTGVNRIDVGNQVLAVLGSREIDDFVSEGKVKSRWSGWTFSDLYDGEMAEIRNLKARLSENWALDFTDGPIHRGIRHEMVQIHAYAIFNAIANAYESGKLNNINVPGLPTGLSKQEKARYLFISANRAAVAAVSAEMQGMGSNREFSWKNFGAERIPLYSTVQTARGFRTAISIDEFSGEGSTISEQVASVYEEGFRLMLGYGNAKHFYGSTDTDFWNLITEAGYWALPVLGSMIFGGGGGDSPEKAVENAVPKPVPPEIKGEHCTTPGIGNPAEGAVPIDPKTGEPCKTTDTTTTSYVPNYDPTQDPNSAYALVGDLEKTGLYSREELS